MRDGLLLLGLCLAGLLVAVKERSPEAGGRLVGQPRIVDGDTLAFDATRLRLARVDAPERGQICLGDAGPEDCGRRAADALAALIGDRPIRCITEGQDRYGRVLAVCFDAGGRDLNAAMVRSGMAVAFGGYRDEERAAAAERIGLWAGDFERPADWRRRQGGLAEMPHDLPGVIGRFWRWLSGLIG